MFDSQASAPDNQGAAEPSPVPTSVCPTRQPSVPRARAADLAWLRRECECCEECIIISPASVRFPSVVRTTLRAGAMLLALAACSESTAPRPRPPAAGVYVLRTLNGSPLPDDNVYPAIVTVAETLVVAPDESYTVAGAYYARYMLTTYRVTAPQTFRTSGDSVFAPTLNQGGNGPGSFGEAVVTTRGDTLTAVYPGSGFSVFTRVANPALPGPVASLLLWNADTLLMQGGTVNVQPLVRRGLDANGLWIVRPPPAVSLTAPRGWTLSGTTLTAPDTGESEATITLTSGQASTPLTVRSVINLGTRNWRLSYACTDGLRKYGYNYPATIFRDSLIVSGPVTSVTYYHPAESDASPRYDVQLAVNETWVQYLSDGEVLTSQGLETVTIQRQAPDSLIYPPTPVDDGVPHPPATVGVVTQQTPRVYTGGAVCPTDLYAGSRPVVLTEIP